MELYEHPDNLFVAGFIGSPRMNFLTAEVVETSARGAVVRTAGAAGGTWETSDGVRGEWAATPLPGPVEDAYGCGDSFAAGLTYALGAGMAPAEAVQLAARCGAACLTSKGPYAGQLLSPG